MMCTERGDLATVRLVQIRNQTGSPRMCKRLQVHMYTWGRHGCSAGSTILISSHLSLSLALSIILTSFSLSLSLSLSLTLCLTHTHTHTELLLSAQMSKNFPPTQKGLISQRRSSFLGRLGKRNYEKADASSSSYNIGMKYLHLSIHIPSIAVTFLCLSIPPHPIPPWQQGHHPPIYPSLPAIPL